MNLKKIKFVVEGILMVAVLILGSLLLCVFLYGVGMPYTMSIWGVVIGVTIATVPRHYYTKIKEVTA